MEFVMKDQKEVEFVYVIWAGEAKTVTYALTLIRANSAMNVNGDFGNL
jgi:hypothetical protein